MLTIKDLKKFLIGYTDDKLIYLDGKQTVAIVNDKHGNMHMSTVHKIGRCIKCDSPVYSRIDATGDSEYIARCPNCGNLTEYQFLFNKTKTDESNSKV